MANEQYKFYDEGWNAKCRGEVFQSTASLDWKDGYRDCIECIEANNNVIPEEI